MICPKCNSENVNTQIVQTGGKTKKHGNGIGGHINNTARGLTAICTLGMSNLIWKNQKEMKRHLFKIKLCVYVKTVDILGIFKRIK